MGRFGNQVDQLLGTIKFAKSLKRTLVLPPFLDYPHGFVKAAPVPFDDVFKVAPLQDLLPVVLMDDFVTNIAPKLWPENKRYVFCQRPRASVLSPHLPPSCNSKDGNPFEVFWDHHNVDFFDDKYFGDIGFNMDEKITVKRWIEYSAKYPILAFTSAPTGFPVKSDLHVYQKHFQWADKIVDDAQTFIKLHLRRPFVAVHLRNNIDWEGACSHVNSNTHFFASAQCTGDNFEIAKPSKELCFPNETAVISSIRKAVDNIQAKSVFVFSDRDHMIGPLYREFGMNVSVRKLPEPDQFISLAIAGLSDHFVANCMSTFSAVTVRQRKYHNEKYTSTSFLGLEIDEKGDIQKKPTHEEL
ncbi:unnamed protein product [Bursaphelenchus xylophilus]|uniref:GDP-fucose protein O-fucosyltransferase 1 n=1 Tax=Bursaphelenchus xylophilus TaxID=6326 RepID=A0A1I7RKT6_BURXY|nr:unnamed protein product [Bursaphelenchus xylophilus]CAG9131107.1 unnamed protein product [Bursaphelenchus xylophilus]